ncbi:glycosyltransferase family 4 protein [Flavobacterium sp. KS-LB2]|uniref:glycosyltransferase family 4 protein n=1 Tax=Flavobacterium sp. KS-LB2 TaxID=3120525 RepID=UPI0030D0DC2F
MDKKKIIRITTVPISMNKILVGQLTFLNTYYNIIGVSSYVEKDFNEIEQREGIKMLDIPLMRTISIKQDFIALLKLIQLFRKERPDIVHTHTPKAGLLGMLASKITRIPVRLHTLGGMPLMELTGKKKKILEFTEKLTYKCAHKIYPNSKGLMDFILEYKFTTLDKVKVLGHGSSNGVDTAFFTRDYSGAEIETEALKDELGIKKTDFVFFFLGRLAKDKGIVELVAAFKKLNNPNLKLLLVGILETENSSLSSDTIETIQDDASIIFPGRTDNVRAYLRLADVFVFPSYREGFPNVLLQAGSMGLPVIATNINGCNEIITNGETGILIPVKDENVLAEKMTLLLENEALRQQFSHKIRKRVEEKFTHSIIWEAVLQEYDTYLK